MIYTDSIEGDCYNIDMNYIVMTGGIQHGKSTMTNILLNELPRAVGFETGQVITEVANAMNKELDTRHDITKIENLNRWVAYMPAILKDCVHVDTTVENLQFSYNDYDKNPKLYKKLFEFAATVKNNPTLISEQITPSNKAAYRSELQWIGAYGATLVTPSIWFDELILRSQIAENEGAEHSILNALRFPAEVPVVKAVEAHIVKVIRPDMVDKHKSDLTEQEADSIEPDTTIWNNGSEPELEVVVKEFATDYSNGTVRKNYFAVK
jgi:hypothetical protein